MMRLNVFFQNRKIGSLSTSGDRGVVFSYSENAPAPVSISMPDLKLDYSEKQCIPFFDGFLPEGNIRSQLASFAHVSSSSTIQLLSRYGEDIAGALSIIPEDDDDVLSSNTYDEISEKEIAAKIQKKERLPLLLTGTRTKLSLAGAENKIPVLYKDGRFFLPHDGAPTNSIIKATDEFVDNEFICNRLACFCGLHVPDMRVQSFETENALLISRYDRKCINGEWTRLHQEDFCQAMAIMPEKKYEESGGPGIKDSVNLIVNHSCNPREDLRQFIRASVFNCIIGNCDAHGKNFSFLYSEDLQHKCLTPFYDIACSTVDDRFDTRFAMKIAGQKDINKIQREDFCKVFPPRLAAMEIDSVVNAFPLAADRLAAELSGKQVKLLSIIVDNAEKRLSILHR